MTGEQTVVFVSHATSEVKSLCSRVIWLEKGKVMAEGDSTTVVDAYLQHVKDSRVVVREKEVVAAR
jgi:ABC-type polysaccharide/polyol phosphate transport system ATPase subunit